MSILCKHILVVESLKDTQKDYSCAIFDFNKSPELSTNETDFYYNRAIANKSVKDFKGAFKDADRA